MSRTILKLGLAAILSTSLAFAGSKEREGDLDVKNVKEIIETVANAYNADTGEEVKLREASDEDTHELQHFSNVSDFDSFVAVLNQCLFGKRTQAGKGENYNEYSAALAQNLEATSADGVTVVYGSIANEDSLYPDRCRVIIVANNGERYSVENLKSPDEDDN